MKKILVIAATAIVALTACSKTEVVEEHPQEIGINAINYVYTKAAHTGDLGVYAWNQNTTKEAFPNTQFTLQKDVWRGVTPQYWPGGNTLRFTVYAPFNNTKATIENGKITNTAVAANVDLLYGSQVYESTKSEGTIPVTLKHAKTLVKFNASCELDDLATIESITLDNAAVSGAVEIVYDELNPNPTIKWTKSAGPIEIDGITSFSVKKEKAPVGNEIKIIPNDTGDETTPKGTCTIKYKLKGQSETLTIQKTLSGFWDKGKRYIYNLYFQSNEISFSVDVEDWVDVPNGEGEKITVEE